MVLYVQEEILMITVDQKQYKNRRLCSIRQVLPKIQLMYGKTPAPESQLKIFFK